MHETSCESCRRAPAQWHVELDQDLQRSERVSFDVCDGCMIVHDPNARVVPVGWDEEIPA
jgi:hypothetical protein